MEQIKKDKQWFAAFLKYYNETHNNVEKNVDQKI